MNEAPLTTITIAQSYAQTFLDDANLQAWANKAFGKGMAVHIGVDFQRPPVEADAPWISIFPAAMRTGPQRGSIEHDLVLIVGISDNVITTTGSYSEMRGLKRLSCELLPKLQKCMDFALPKARLQEMEVEFEIGNHPLLEAIIFVTVIESRPTGLRR